MANIKLPAKLKSIFEEYYKICDKIRELEYKLDITSDDETICLTFRGHNNKIVGKTKTGLTVLFSDPPEESKIVQLIDYEKREGRKTLRDDSKSIYIKCFVWQYITDPEIVDEEKVKNEIHELEEQRNNMRNTFEDIMKIYFDDILITNNIDPYKFRLLLMIQPEFVQIFNDIFEYYYSGKFSIHFTVSNHNITITYNYDYDNDIYVDNINLDDY